jgi:hypothetical protein
MQGSELVTVEMRFGTVTPAGEAMSVVVICLFVLFVGDKGLSCNLENTKQNINSFGRVWIGQI